jgi:hypothetical protein
MLVIARQHIENVMGSALSVASEIAEEAENEESHFHPARQFRQRGRTKSLSVADHGHRWVPTFRLG